MFLKSSMILFLLCCLFFLGGSVSSPMLLEFDLVTLPVNFFSLSIFLDSVSSKFLVTVFLISTSVLLYSNSYMDDEKFSLRFTYLVLLFISSMAILIIGGSVPLLLLSWDGLGLSSYFLIVHYQSFKSSGSGLITVISNRIGDIFIISSSIIILSEVTSWYFLNSNLSVFYNFLLGGMMILGAITKSAMFPYCTWLPEAMAAPTPVSSLVHSSTLVTAGVYIILRAYYWIPQTLILIIGILSSFTLFLSSISALFCLDFKKVIALSTLSQLAFMITTLAMGLVNIAFFHLITHALFKSSLFLAAGSFIHLGHANQDMRFKDLTNISFSSKIIITIPILALSGAPFMAGFFSKEMILMVGFTSSSSLTLISTLTIGALLTMMYSLRMLFSLSYFSLSNKMLAESKIMDLSKIFLFFLSIYGGWIYTVSHQPIYSWAPALSMIVQSMFLFSLFVWLSKKNKFNPLKALSWNQFNFLGRVTNTNTPTPQLKFSNSLVLLWESGWQEILGPKFISHLVILNLNKFYKLDFKNFSLLIFILMLGVTSILILL